MTDVIKKYLFKSVKINSLVQISESTLGQWGSNNLILCHQWGSNNLILLLKDNVVLQKIRKHNYL